MSIGFERPGSPPRAATRGKAEPAESAKSAVATDKRTGKLGFELNEKHPAGTLYSDGAPIAPTTLVELLAGDVCSLVVSALYRGRNDVLKAVEEATRPKPRAGVAAPTTPEQTNELVTALRALEHQLAQPKVVDKAVIRDESGRLIGVRETTQ